MVLSNRLQCCLDMVPRGTHLIDIGTDHAHLPIAAVSRGISDCAVAADLRSGPLESARKNVSTYHLQDKIKIIQSDGMDRIPKISPAVVVMSGMGGDSIQNIIQNAESFWIENNICYILQPQSKTVLLRKFLREYGFSVLQETLTEERGFLYSILLAKKSDSVPKEEHFDLVSNALLSSKNPLLPKYLNHMLEKTRKIREGLLRSTNIQKDRIDQYDKAVKELRELIIYYGNCE